MKLKFIESDNLENWYLIERAEHPNRSGLRRDEHGISFHFSGRIGNADIEGTAEEMQAIGIGITNRARVSFKRCAVNATSEPVHFWSPRNSIDDPSDGCSFGEADDLAKQIEAFFQAGTVLIPSDAR